MGTVKLLIISNHKRLITDIKKVFVRSNINICGAASKISQAHKIILNKNPDFVIIDPNKNSEYDGIETANNISSKLNIPYIFVAEKIDRKSMIKAKKTNACGYFSTDFLKNDHFTTFIDFAISNHKRETQTIHNDNINSNQLKLIQKEIQNSKSTIQKNSTKLNTLISIFSEFQEKTNTVMQSKDKFFSIIAHDMKGPLQGLIGYTEILSKESDSMEKTEIQEIANDLNDSAKLLLKLLEDFLHWARIQRGAIEIVPSVQNIKKLAEINIDLLTLQALQKEIHLVNKAPDLLFVADLNMVNTVLRNLISNAIKFTNKNGNIVISAKDLKDGFLEVSVADNGVGMSKDKISKLFRIDTNQTTLGTANETGTGLGLILCKELIEKNNGSIRVDSRINKGTTFYFTIPKAKNK